MRKSRKKKNQLIEHIFTFLFNTLYNQFSWMYDQVAWIVSAGLWKKWVFSVLPYLGDNRILELGFGPGHLQKEGLRLSKKMYGIDVSPNMVKICKKRVEEANYTPNISRANARHLPFSESIFDQIVATFPAPYIFEKQTLSEINRVLTSDGQLLIIPTALTKSKNLIHRFFSWLFNLGTNSGNIQTIFEQSFIKPLQIAGFDTSHQELLVKSSKVLLITAQKKQ